MITISESLLKGISLLIQSPKCISRTRRFRTKSESVSTETSFWNFRSVQVFSMWLPHCGIFLCFLTCEKIISMPIKIWFLMRNSTTLLNEILPHQSQLNTNFIWTLLWKFCNPEIASLFQISLKRYTKLRYYFHGKWHKNDFEDESYHHGHFVSLENISQNESHSSQSRGKLLVFL